MSNTHTLLQGDSLKVLKVLNDNSVDAVVTDPPYGIGTTGIVCANLNRNFIGIELEEKSFNTTKDRISKHELFVNKKVEPKEIDVIKKTEKEKKKNIIYQIFINPWRDDVS